MKPKRRPTAIRKSITTRARVVLTPFDSVKYLNSDKAIAAYLNDALADGSTEEILMAFFQVARARGMSRVARVSGLGRESLYKALSPKSKPRFETIVKVARALGVQITARVA